MSQGELERRTVKTWLGGLSYWALDEAPNDPRPVLLVLLDSAGSPRQLSRTPALLADLCHVAIAELPLRAPDAPPAGTLAQVAAVVSEATHLAFRGRPVILMAVGDAGVVAATVHAPEIVRAILVEPVVRTASLEASLLDTVAARVRDEPERAAQQFLQEVYGVSASAPPAERSHLAAFGDPRRPLDVLLGGRLPGSGVGASGVAAGDREWLARQRSTSIQVGPEAGAALLREAGGLVVSAIRRAFAWAAGLNRAPEPLARGLAAACPRDAARVAYLGPAAAAFRAAYSTFNPTAEVADGMGEGAAFDLVAAQVADPAAIDVPALAARLADGGTVVALSPLGEGARRIEASLAASGLSLAPPAPDLTPIGSALARGVKAGPDAVALDVVAYAQRLMDIRTHLPARALRTCPGLDVHYGAPPFVQPPAPAPPRVVVMQRPAAWSTDTWVQLAARAIWARQVVVIEIDDHPELISQIVRGRSADPHEWDRFRLVHAVQTSTEPLREVFQAYNPEVEVWPNAVFDLPPFPTAPRPRRVFYGGVSRGPFAVEVARALAPAIAAHPDVEFHVLGDRGVFEALPTDRKQFSDYLPFRAYLEAMAACSISLSPLEDRAYVETKSDAKYLDAARAGLLTIASPTVYSRTIESGRNGLIATSLDDWPRMLGHALDDAGARERMARAAWEDVRRHRMFGQQIPLRRDWYASLVARQEELDRAILERAPAVAAELEKLRMRAGLK